MSNQENAKFWFNLKTLKVEHGLKSAAPYRVGPFETEAEAKLALQLINDRSKKWNTEEETER